VRWAVFAVFAYVFMVLELSLRNLLVVSAPAAISPSFVAVLVVFIALFAPRTTALWAAWILGLVMDLTLELEHGDAWDAGPLIGPYALGYPFGAYLLLQARAMLLRGRALTMAVMTIMFFAAATIVAVFIYVLHGWYPGEDIAWADLGLIGELGRRLGIAVYSGLLALILAPLLFWTTPLWSFRTPAQRAAGWR
jgi:rod shape-determining protein MreD